MTSGVLVKQPTPDAELSQRQELGRRIYAARVARHLSQLQLAERVGLRSDAHIGRIENAKGSASARVLREIARELDLDANMLLSLGGFIRQLPAEALNDPDVQWYAEQPKPIQRFLRSVREVAGQSLGGFEHLYTQPSTWDLGTSTDNGDRDEDADRDAGEQRRKHGR